MLSELVENKESFTNFEEDDTAIEVMETSLGNVFFCATIAYRTAKGTGYEVLLVCVSVRV